VRNMEQKKVEEKPEEKKEECDKNNESMITLIRDYAFFRVEVLKVLGRGYQEENIIELFESFKRDCRTGKIQDAEKNRPASLAQVNFIKDLVTQKGTPGQNCLKLTLEKSKKSQPEELNADEASVVISALKQLPAR